jgi:hypothetical protein
MEMYFQMTLKPERCPVVLNCLLPSWQEEIKHCSQSDLSEFVMNVFNSLSTQGQPATKQAGKAQ